MTIDEIIAFMQDLDGVLTLRPEPGDGSPEISWGDTFFSYSPDPAAPRTPQPFATIVTKNYPGDESSRLDRPDTFRVNIAAGKEAFIERTGHAPHEPAVDDDPALTDAVIAHPVYGSAGWLAVVNPGRRTDAATCELLRSAYHLARSRHERRAG
ncbi:DUF6194 family protein [Streptomyces sp. NBC_01022]|uniref:DUF6194 family protein n=1 Tax=Streptomyces sp. NBC_01022 TaxID=2903723 RepID=UPI002DD8DEF1|nr:DUF6194 family protein [Streptomyces sp. NBC_01022]WRZ81874.1 DUF6194 family protein [Streptomyces sp. NBC_01022]